MIGTAPRRGGNVLLVAVGLLVAACGGADAVEGADRDRPPEPSMDLVRFQDVAGDVGLDFQHGAYQWAAGGDPAAMMGGGVCWVDYDRDGWLDLFAVNTWSDGEWGRWREAGGLPASRLYRNDRGRFTDVTDATGAGIETRGNGCVAADLDGDDWTDLYVTSDRANVLLWNEGGDRFVDGSAAAGVDVSGWQGGAGAGDLDGDGRLDLFVAGYADTNRPIAGATKGFPNGFEPEPDLVFHNQGASDGERPTFDDVADEVGVEPTQLDYGLGVVMSDVDRDGDLDVVVANDTQPNRLYLNGPRPGAPGFGFDEVGRDVGLDDDNAGMGVAAGDYNGDGRPDVAITNLGEQLHVVARSDGAGAVFVDALAEIGLPDLGAGHTGWGTNWMDADLDGDLDLAMVHGFIPVGDLVADRELVRLYENQAAVGGFVDATPLVGLDEVGPLLARGSAAADFDNDGDL
ncbi:MAG: VCBS repeat-containing protein, partial [Acidimicrobiia bacterium]|nr:VCBS repeat-containing protein [Acidimicrobiia bacterium]